MDVTHLGTGARIEGSPGPPATDDAAPGSGLLRKRTLFWGKFLDTPNPGGLDRTPGASDFELGKPPTIAHWGPFACRIAAP